MLVLGFSEMGLIFTSSWEGTQPGPLTQTGQTNGTFDTMRHHAQDLEGGAGWGRVIAARERTGH